MQHHGSRYSALLALLLAGLASAGLPVFAQPSISASAAAQIRALLAEKATRNPAQQKLDSQIHYAAKIKRGQSIAVGIATLPSVQSTLETDGGGLVHVDIRAHVSADLLAAMRGLGGRIENSFPQYQAVRAWIPLLAAETLAGRADVLFIHPAARGIVNSGPDVNGVYAHAANVVQSYGFLGAGVKVGVLSDGVDSLAGEQSAGHLPSGVTVISGQQGSGDEGTAMLEIVYSMAPGAQLYFATAYGGDAQMAANILALSAAGCQVIVDDFTYFDEPVFQDGIIAQAVNTVTAAGALYFSSAANSGNYDSGTSGTWEGDFVNSGASLGPIVESGTLNQFGSGNNDPITYASGFYSIKWSDPSGASCNDYDMFILNSSLTSVLAVSNNYQICVQDPYEYISASSSIVPAGSTIVIVNFMGLAAARAIHVDTERGTLAINTSGAAFGHNAAAAAITVAAADVATASGGAFTGGSNNPPESFSSDGPRKMFYNPDGTPITPNNYLFSTNGGTTLSKVDITAADGVITGVSGFNPFYGTSAAAPHAAGIAALIMSANPSLSAAQVKSALLSTALPVYGYNSRTVGSGIAMANLSLSFGPSITTSAASAVKSTSATLNGSVVPNGADTHVWFQYSTNSSMAGSKSTAQQDAGSGVSSVPFTATITGLASNTTYYFQAWASNSAGIFAGSKLSFTTLSPFQLLADVLSKTVPSSCTTPPVATSFFPTDTQAELYFMVSNVSTGDVARADWYSPAATLYHSGSWAPLGGVGTYCFWAGLPINGTTVASQPGAWSVKVYWDNNLIATLPFTVRQSTAPSLVWMNKSTRQATINYYGGTGGATYQGWNWMANPGYPGWSIVGTGDFDRNGTPDIVWQNDTTRQVTVHYYGGVNGDVNVGWAWLSATGSPGWKVVAIADFDGNGVPDLVWQNDTTRAVTVQYYGGANGASYLGWNWLSDGYAGWTVIAAADFNHDGVPDLVWQNDTTRQVTVHYYGGSGGATEYGWAFLNATGNPGWTVVGADDFDANGVADLVWQNTTTGQVTVNYYTGSGGTTYTGWAWLNTANNSAWRPVVE